MRSTSVALASVSPASARSGSRSSASTGLGGGGAAPAPPAPPPAGRAPPGGGGPRRRAPPAPPRGPPPPPGDREARQRCACALTRVDERGDRGTEHQVARAETGLEAPGDLGEGQRRLVGSVARRVGAADDQHEARALHADEHVDAELSSRAAHLIDVEQRRGCAHQHGDLAVAVPAESGDAAGQLGVGLAAQDRVGDARRQARIPQSPGFGGARVDIGGGEGDLARVEQHALAQIVAPTGDPFLRHRDGHPDQLQRLGEAHAAQQLTGRGGEDVGCDPRR